MPRPDLFTCHLGEDRVKWVRANKYALSAAVKRLIDSARAEAEVEPAGLPRCQPIDSPTGRSAASMAIEQERESRARLKRTHWAFAFSAAEKGDPLARAATLPEGACNPIPAMFVASMWWEKVNATLMVDCQSPPGRGALTTDPCCQPVPEEVITVVISALVGTSVVSSSAWSRCREGAADLVVPEAHRWQQRPSCTKMIGGRAIEHSIYTVDMLLSAEGVRWKQQDTLDPAHGLPTCSTSYLTISSGLRALQNLP